MYAASSSCYGIPDEYPTKETAEIRPQYPYALTKYLGEELMKQVSKHLHRSIVYSMENREDALAYAMQFARDMPTELADRFVGMYVNDVTLDYGDDGRRAVQLLLDRAFDRGIIPNRVEAEFIG